MQNIKGSEYIPEQLDVLTHDPTLVIRKYRAACVPMLINAIPGKVFCKESTEKKQMLMCS